MEIVLHSKKSVSTKVSKEILPFQQAFSIQSVMLKVIQLDARSRGWTKNPTTTLTPSVVRNPTLTPNPPKKLQLLTIPTPTRQPREQPSIFSRRESTGVKNNFKNSEIRRKTFPAKL